MIVRNNISRLYPRTFAKQVTYAASWREHTQIPPPNYTWNELCFRVPQGSISATTSPVIQVADLGLIVGLMLRFVEAFSCGNAVVLRSRKRFRFVQKPSRFNSWCEFLNLLIRGGHGCSISQTCYMSLRASGLLWWVDISLKGAGGQYPRTVVLSRGSKPLNNLKC